MSYQLGFKVIAGALEPVSWSQVLPQRHHSSQEIEYKLFLPGTHTSHLPHFPPAPTHLPSTPGLTPEHHLAAFQSSGWHLCPLVLVLCLTPQFLRHCFQSTAGVGGFGLGRKREQREVGGTRKLGKQKRKNRLT